MLSNQHLNTLGLIRWERRYQDDAVENLNSSLMVIIAEPLTDRANQMLTDMLKAIGLKREEIQIANIQNTQHLDQQITEIKPALLFAIGKAAAHHLIQTDAPLSTLRGQKHTFSKTNTPVIVTYHPIDLLEHPQDKKKAYQDLLFVSSQL